VQCLFERMEGCTLEGYRSRTGKYCIEKQLELKRNVVDKVGIVIRMNVNYVVNGMWVDDTVQVELSDYFDMMW